MLRKHARAVVCPAGANIAHTPVSLRSTVAPVRNPATPPYDVKDKGDAKRNRELTQGCGPGMPGPYASTMFYHAITAHVPGTVKTVPYKAPVDPGL